MEQFAGAVVAFQVKFIALVDAADAMSPAGAGGTAVQDAEEVPLVTVNTAVLLVMDPAAFLTVTS
jgi:hypothetical protein